MTATASNSLTDLLKRTSRSFYLSLRVLPAPVRPQIGLAYLLARTTDTIADTDLVQIDQRLEALERLRVRILGTDATPLDFGELARQQGSPAERALLEQCEDSLALLQTLHAEDLKLVRTVLDTITSGQALDLRHFGSPAAGTVAALRTDDELDDYTYRVAGCVGEFWTKICRAHLFPNASLDDAKLLADGIRFGKGLQLVNILRDLPTDLRNGRCYLPAERLKVLGLSPGDLLRPDNEASFRPLYNAWLNRAEAHLAAGWAYTNALPRGQARLRLACAWPVLIGIKTIERLRTASVLDPDTRVKTTRAEVRGIMVGSVLRYPFRRAWENLGPRSDGIPHRQYS